MKEGFGWLAKGSDDFEYKKYKILAYLQMVHNHFKKNEVYPFLNDLKLRYEDLSDLQNAQLNLYNSTRRLYTIDLKNRKLIYRPNLIGNKMSLEEIVNFAEPLLKNKIHEGEEIFNYAEKICRLEELGIMNSYKREGLLFVPRERRSLYIFRYKIGIFSDAKFDFGVNLRFLRLIQKSVWETYEAIKIRIVNNISNLWSPSVYILDNDTDIPLIPTLVPVAKSQLNKNLRNY